MTLCHNTRRRYLANPAGGSLPRPDRGGIVYANRLIEHDRRQPPHAIASVYHPAREVGGDFFQIIPLHDETTLVAIGDVSGKGLKAAMNVALIIGTIRTLAEFETDPTKILAGLNRRLFGRMQGGFTTALLLKLDGFGHCTLANAGHLPPFFNTNELTLNESLPLGIVAEAEFENQQLILRKGDCLALYTDGVPEARSKKGELYGFERTRILLSNTFSAEPVAQAARDCGQEDDITVLTIHTIAEYEFLAPEITSNTANVAPVTERESTFSDGRRTLRIRAKLVFSSACTSSALWPLFEHL